MKYFNQYLEEQLKNPEFKQAYDALAPQYELATQIIEARLKKGLSQHQLAHKMGTKQSSIARLESGEYNPSVKLLVKVARATESRLRVTFE